MHSTEQRRLQLDTELGEFSAYRAAVVEERESLSRQQAAFNAERVAAMEDRAAYEKARHLRELEMWVARALHGCGAKADTHVSACAICCETTWGRQHCLHSVVRLKHGVAAGGGWRDSTASRDHLEAGFRTLEQERQSVYEHVRSLESYKELNKDMLVGEPMPHAPVHSMRRRLA